MFAFLNISSHSGYKYPIHIKNSALYYVFKILYVTVSASKSFLYMSVFGDMYQCMWTSCFLGLIIFQLEMP